VTLSATERGVGAGESSTIANVVLHHRKNNYGRHTNRERSRSIRDCARSTKFRMTLVIRAELTDDLEPSDRWISPIRSRRHNAGGMRQRRESYAKRGSTNELRRRRCRR